jgi:hypothetical protein
MKDQPIEDINMKKNMTVRIFADVFFLDFRNMETYITSTNIKIKKYCAGGTKHRKWIRQIHLYMLESYFLKMDYPKFKIAFDIYYYIC